MTPGDPQWWRVSREQEPLTRELALEGWHFCQDFDLDLVGPGDRNENGRCQWCRWHPSEDPSAPEPTDP